MAERASSSNSRNRGESVVVDHGRCRSRCGYCKSGGRTSISHGLSAHSITVDDYQALLDRGWRRSGSFLYKPEMERTCCPSYTIRLKASNFVPSKEQVRVSRRMQRFLDGMLDVKRSDHVEDEPCCSMMPDSSFTDASSSAMDLDLAAKKSSLNCGEKHNQDDYIYRLSKEIDRSVTLCIEQGKFPHSVHIPRATVKKVTLQAKKRHAELSGDLSYTSNISFQIAAALRRLQAGENNICQSGLSRNGATQKGQSTDLSPQIVAEKLACSLDQQAELPSLFVKACNGHLNFYSTADEMATCEVPVDVETSTKSSSSSGTNAKCRGMLCKSAFPLQKKRRLEIRLKRSSFELDEFDLYRRYQIRVHDDKADQVTEGSYKRFLVDTPLIFVPPSDDNSVPPCGFGSFHQQYLIDGQLVAVGVVDILPRCLSSKYLFWDPDLAFLSLGKYSALQEISWVRDTEIHCPSLQNYYLGYYIHSCSKMRYKAAYRPSELLCPLRYQWVPSNIAGPLLDKKPYVVLSDFLENKASSPCGVLHNSVEQPGLETDREDHIEDLSDGEEKMGPDFKGSAARPGHNAGPETSSLGSVDELRAVDISSIVIDLDGARLKFKDLRQAFRPSERWRLDSLEKQLRKYVRVVDPGLSGCMVYSLS